jgi:hypothetical protein
MNDQVASFPRFWFCFRVGGGAPTYRHESEESARIEAERLVRVYGGTVLVLEAIAEVRRIDVQWTNFEKKEQQPW